MHVRPCMLTIISNRFSKYIVECQISIYNIADPRGGGGYNTPKGFSLSVSEYYTDLPFRAP